METWAWLAAYLVGFALLQLYLYRYFMRRSATADSPERTTPVGESRSRSLDPPENVPDGDLVSCTTCGAYNENDAMFTYCRECGDRLN